METGWPWLNYGGADPRANPDNWAYGGNGTYTYVGPAIEGMPNDGTGTLYVPEATIPTEGPIYTAEFQAPYVGTEASYDASGYDAGLYGVPAGSHNYDAAEPYGGGGAIPEYGYGGYDPLSSANPGTPPPISLGGPGTGGSGTLSYEPPPLSPASLADPTGAPSGQTLGYGSGQSDFITPHIPVYDGMAMGGGGAPGSVPVGGDPLLAGTAGDPYAAGGTGGDPYYGDPYYSAGDAAWSGYDMGYGVDPYTGAPLMPNGEVFGSEPQASPYGFDPFLWSGVKNPLPPPTPLRNQIMQAGGFAGPAWYPAPPPQPPGPMSFVRQRLGMQPVGSTLETKAPVPGFRYDGTPKSEPQEELDKFVPADQVGGMLPPLPPMFPPRRY